MASVWLGLLGMTIYSAGVIFQKKGSGWLVWKGKRNGRFMRMLGMWLAGILFSYVLSTLPLGFASKNLPPHVVSALSGWSIMAIAILSFLFLKEKLYASDVIYSLVIAGCILLMNSFSGAAQGHAVEKRFLYYLLFMPFLILVPVFFKFTNRKYKTILLSTFSGILGGLTFVFMNILVKENGGSIPELAGSTYIYIYFLAGIAAAAAMQVAYRFGDVILIVPLQTSFTIIYPVICSYFLLHSSITLIQVVSILIIVVCCWGILKKR